jgi:hypothetical protein
MNNEEGYLLCVFGTPIFFNLCLRLINNIRQFDTTRKICVLTDKLEFKHDIDDELVFIKLFDPKNHSHKSIKMNTEWSRYGLIPKLFQHSYSPFTITCYMDVDMVFHKDFTFLWKEAREHNSPISIPGVEDEMGRSPSEWHWGKVNDVIKHCQFPIPQIWSTWFVYHKDFTDMIEKENTIEYILDNVEKWKVQSSFRGGYPDEIIYSLIMGIHKWKTSDVLYKWIWESNENCDPCNKNIVN